MVLRVDKEKGYIDLSKRRVAAEDISACEEKYNKSKLVHSIVRHVAETTGNEVEPLYEAIGWPLYKAYGHAFEAFKACPGSMVCNMEICSQRLAVGMITPGQPINGRLFMLHVWHGGPSNCLIACRVPIYHFR